MADNDSVTELTPEQESVLQDIVQHLGLERECLEIIPVPLTDWPDGLAIYYIYRKDRHGRIFYQYACYEGELYSPYSADGLERLLKRLLSSRRFELTAEQMINLLLMYSRPEPYISFITNMEQDLSQESRDALDMYYGLTDLTPQLTLLEEGERKLIFWTLNVRRESLKRWTAYISQSGRTRIIEDIGIELRNAREGYA